MHAKGLDCQKMWHEGWWTAATCKGGTLNLAEVRAIWLEKDSVQSVPCPVSSSERNALPSLQGEPDYTLEGSLRCRRAKRNHDDLLSFFCTVEALRIDENDAKTIHSPLLCHRDFCCDSFLKMTSTAVSKKDTRFAPTPANNQQFFRRERSFVLQRPSQNVPTGNHFQQRERSFIRDGNRSGAGSSSNSFPNSVGSNSGKTRGGSYHNGNNGPAAPASAAAGRGSKPNMEIYRPPSMRSGEVPAGGRGQFPQNSTDHQPPRLTKSRTSLELNNNSTRAANNKVAQQSAAAATVTSITIHKQPVNEATASPAGQFVLQRSKSSGSHLSLQQQKVPLPTPASTNATPKVCNSELPDVSSFPEAAQILLRKIAFDPDGANSRSVMEAVKTLFNRVIESSRYASSIARYCSYVIEKEAKETFRESLLNTCQESFQERDRILRLAGESSQRWVAFINFLNEMYLQLKRRNFNSKIKTSSTRPSPDLILLSLLAESCCATLRQPSSQSLQELECLFFVLTGIGRDVETELPTKMFAIWNAIRDAFLEMNALPGAAQRTLLQLVELRAAKWQLPATAVTYYYPSVSGSAY